MQSWATIAAGLALLANGAVAQNMLRFACSQLVVDRVDPLVNPGLRYTPHLHQIVGGSDHLSNYWTAVMFFKAKNGSYHRVPQVGNGGPQGALINKGGLDVYYIPSGKVTAFKPGFRMLAGNAANTDPKKVSSGNICHRCWTSTNEGNFVGGAPCTGSDTVDIPQDTKCKMIRQTIIFPTCWDGKNLDSPDHKSHVTYSGTGATGGGSCPSSHPVKLPQIMYELMWNVSSFANDKSIWPDSGPALVYSMNLGGAAAHGDYVFGWKGDSLQKAMDKGCNLNKDCPSAGLTAQTPAQYNACTIKQQAPEPVDGWLKAMPMGEMAIKA
ncbi:hypothetical protein QBC45DRAFT_477735 [Copromyces sp. CBS 386.78]|nr:hypothetical protein QBC45DRAFT_477735 [Copromyces sp. CBS 386.78]